MEKVESSNKKVKIRNDDDKKRLVRRLSVIEGQVRGIKQMIEDDRYCGDVLIQISAVNMALQALGNSVLKEHLQTCVVEQIKMDNTEVIDEVIELIKRLS